MLLSYNDECKLFYSKAYKRKYVAAKGLFSMSMKSIRRSDTLNVDPESASNKLD